MQATLLGGRSSNQKVSDARKSKGIFVPGHKDHQSDQLPIGKSKEDLIHEREENKKCPICRELKPKYFDVCHNDRNVNACEECLIIRHQKHGYRWPGYVDMGDSIQFYSQTTGLETIPYDHVISVSDGLCFNTPLFPSTIHTKSKPCDSTYGITDECAQFLIVKLDMVREDDEEFNKNNGEDQRTWVVKNSAED